MDRKIRKSLLIFLTYSLFQLGWERFGHADRTPIAPAKLYHPSFAENGAKTGTRL
jgi:hypothetical protein